ncbi:glycosyltransferase [Patescibacteria group bacterium]|nr:MAG: glycosyltransferase [Patescibacteria group bacterium]
MENNQLKITIGIPTYIGGPSLVKAAQSLLASEGVENFHLLVSVDGKRLDSEIKSALEVDPRVEVIENLERGGQVARIRQILSLSFDQDIVILTQDDLLFGKKTIAEIVSAFESDSTITMVTARPVPLPPTTFFERIVHAGFYMVKTIEQRWNNGDNFMNAAGRCISFRKGMTRHIFEEIQEDVISCDAHFYFINKKYGGKFFRNEQAPYYFRSPKSLADHLKQSKKYQNVAEELYKYRRIDAYQEYAIPTRLKIDAALWGLVNSPFYALLYFAVLIYTRFHGDQTFKKATRFWDTDKSTKEI